MVELIKTLSVISYSAAALCLLFSIFIWFRFKILSVINDLSGKTARKAIEQIRNNNIRSGDKAYRSSQVNIKRGPLTESIPDANSAETEKLPTDQIGSSSPETTLFHEEGKTELLLNSEGTTVLNKSINYPADSSERNKVKITILEQVVLIHTSEVIS